MTIVVRPVVRRAACAMLIALAPAVSSAAGDEPTYSLSWSRAEGARECITGNALAKAVEARLGRSVFVSPAVAELTLEARIEGGPSTWLATITVQDREGRRVGQRELKSGERDCRALDQSLSLMLALAIDPNATLSIPGSPVERPPIAVVPVPPREVRPVAPPLRVETPPPSTTVLAPTPPRIPLAHVEGSARVSFGMLPGIATGVAVAVVVPLQESWVVRAGAGVWLPAHTAGPDGGVNISQFGASLGFCGRLLGSGSFLLLCANAEPGLVAAAGYGFSQSFVQDRRFALMTGPSAKVGVRLGGRFWAQLGGDLLIPVVRHQFYYRKADDSPMDVFRTSAVTAGAELAALLAFP